MSQKMQKRQVHMSTGILSNQQVPSNVIYMETEFGGCFVIYMEKENSLGGVPKTYTRSFIREVTILAPHGTHLSFNQNPSRTHPMNWHLP